MTSGRVILCGVDVTRRKPADRGVGYVPQDLGLFPTMTVRGHLEFALRIRRLATKEINSRSRSWPGCWESKTLEPPRAWPQRRRGQRVALGPGAVVSAEDSVAGRAA